VGQDILDSNFVGVSAVRENEIISDQTRYRCIPLNIGVFLIVINQKRYRCCCESFRHACAVEKCFGRDWNIGISRKSIPLSNLSTCHREESLTYFCAYCIILNYSDAQPRNFPVAYTFSHESIEGWCEAAILGELVASLHLVSSRNAGMVLAGVRGNEM
jgi:hypothetical protein